MSKNVFLNNGRSNIMKRYPKNTKNFFILLYESVKLINDHSPYDQNNYLKY